MCIICEVQKKRLYDIFYYINNVILRELTTHGIQHTERKHTIKTLQYNTGIAQSWILFLYFLRINIWDNLTVEHKIYYIFLDDVKNNLPLLFFCVIIRRLQQNPDREIHVFCICLKKDMLATLCENVNKFCTIEDTFCDNENCNIYIIMHKQTFFA